MELRRLVRGRVDWPRLEAVVRDLRDRYDRQELHVRFLEADNWLSTPMVVDDEWFVKVISRQNSLVHALFTTGRNLGAFSSGTEGFFEHFGTPLEMAEHELEATRRMREIGLNAPEPVESFEVDGLGILVLEYLQDFRTLDELDREVEKRLAPQVFSSLRTMHDHNLVHGDLRAENVLIVDDEVYFIDATNVSEEGAADAKSYDLACALAAIEPLIGAKSTVNAALESYEVDALLDALDFLDFVNIRPDHDFDAAALKGVIEQRAT
ncbi:protein kinase family protein [Halogeometricum borinquense]|uniref:non-specific serine/threonine protein kinase n=1 Tax=Halogeometricum borinquense TaxID=60847 RepID=A0A6C0UEE4_9EURY|nr:RIO1 family regulatory kinase/ATPase [Halogeometricum borinquense]QIB73796.1 protein kinase family protein [Halogeometricum borinquense]QIQ76847.1 protein kinase family protein [Halogeometricum borinquense]